MVYGEADPYESFLRPWDEVYLLGWYDRSGHPYLSSWEGPATQDFVVTGCHSLNMPLWDAVVPTTARVYSVPEGKTAKEFAAEVGGYHAIGWRYPNKFARKKK